MSDEQTDDEAIWYNVKYSVILDTEKSSENRIDVASTKGTWDEDDPGSFMMKRVREKLITVAAKKGIDLHSGAGPFYMRYDEIWKYLWAYSENRMG